ncbi:hypothetical protein EG329_006566 [Mollisiaceae sp. DMI_Dod_QoI]|nr:hypothetical protein EG329_006566 [Helotiales sp. DMI_Dod_QoI]
MDEDLESEQVDQLDEDRQVQEAIRRSKLEVGAKYSTTFNEQLGERSARIKRKAEEELRTQSVKRSTSDFLSMNMPSSKDLSPASLGKPLSALSKATIDISYRNGALRITRTPGRRKAKNCVNLEDVIHKNHLVSACVFSFFIGDRELYDHLPLSHSSDAVPIYIGRDANQAIADLISSNLRQLYSNRYGKNYHAFYAWSPGSSHSKILILVYPEFLRLVIISCNMMDIDTVLGDNHWYIHDLPKISARAEPEPSSFEVDLLAHLQALCAPDVFLDSIRGVYDYSTVKVHLVTSVPGVCAASIGNLSAKWLNGFNDCALGNASIGVAGKDCAVPDLRLFYPSVGDVKKAHESTQDAASNIGCHTRPWDSVPNDIKNIFHHYESKDTGRLFHQKLILAYNPSDTNALPYYVYVGSANLSQSAWRALEQDKKANETTCNMKLIKMSNFECGVAIPGYLVEGLLEQGTESWQSGMVPYVQTAKRYDLPKDRPWNEAELLGRQAVPAPLSGPNVDANGSADPRWVQNYQEGYGVLTMMRKAPMIVKRTNYMACFAPFVQADQQETMSRIEKYGPIVRIAPNEYSVDDVEAAKLIYKVGNGFVKAPWYWAWMPPDASKANLFADLDPHHHTSQRRKFASAYTMTSSVGYEPCVNECTAIVAQRFSELAIHNHTIDFGHWLHCYTTDVISLITFAHRLGLLDEGQDKDQLFEAGDHHNAYSTFVGIFPSLHRFLFPLLLQTGSYGALLNFAIKQIEGRRKLLKDSTKNEHEGPPDFMARFLAVHEATPDKMSKDDLFGISIANIAAGSETTAITLSAIFYHLLEHPTSYQRLQQEIDAACTTGLIDDPITFRQALNLPYLQAVIKEALRLHPAVGLGLQRCVPAGGAILNGRMFPEGTTVGVNAWVAHRNTSIYGHDADKWRPERWLEIEADGRGAEVEQYFFSFGMGSRTCIGKNIGLLELNKLVPQLLRQFDLVLDEELNKHKWRTVNRFLVKPQNFRGRVMLRTIEKSVGQTV